MTLTRDCKETIRARVQRDPVFRELLAHLVCSARASFETASE
jgi:hypothetical protein